MSVVCLLNIATAPATEPQELVTHPPHLRTLPVSYQSQPVGVDQPQLAGVHQPQPIGVHQPQPIGVHQPMPVNNRNLQQSPKMVCMLIRLLQSCIITNQTPNYACT